MKQLVIFPKGSLTAKDKERMSKEGFLAIEVANPSAVVMLMPTTSVLSGDDILMAAMKGLMAPVHNKDAFADEMFRRLSENEKNKKEGIHG